MSKIDLTNPDFAYFFGFVQTDGHLRKDTRNRGSISIELNYQDIDLLKKFNKLFNKKQSINIRTRNTNFKTHYKSCSWRLYNIDIRNQLHDFGLPYGTKSDIIKPPSVNFSKVDYFRGIIDGDGSLGLDKRNVPFISLATKSDFIKEAYVDLIFEITGKEKSINRNKRDNMYNIVLFAEDAQNMVHKLYHENCLCLNRKKELANIILSWDRPDNFAKRSWPIKKWTKEEDVIVLSHSVKDAAKILQRTEKSVTVRVWRLKRNEHV